MNLESLLEKMERASREVAEMKQQISPQQTPPASPVPLAEKIQPALHPALTRTQSAELWCYIDIRTDNPEQKGPVPVTYLKERLEDGRLPLDTPVWAEGMEGWKLAHEMFRLPLEVAPRSKIKSRKGSTHDAAPRDSGNTGSP